MTTGLQKIVAETRHRFPADHPIWKMGQTIVQTGCAVFAFTIVLYVTASNFDETELKAILGGGGATGALLTALRFWKSS